MCQKQVGIGRYGSLSWSLAIYSHSKRDEVPLIFDDGSDASWLPWLQGPQKLGWCQNLIQTTDCRLLENWIDLDKSWILQAVEYAFVCSGTVPVFLQGCGGKHSFPMSSLKGIEVLYGVPILGFSAMRLYMTWSSKFSLHPCRWEDHPSEATN